MTPKESDMTNKSIDREVQEGVDLHTLESAARGKSLGEKLYAALSRRGTFTGPWSRQSADVQTHYESAGLAFAASLTHDETASAVSADLENGPRASEAECERVRLLLSMSEALDAQQSERARTAEALVTGLRQELSERAPFSKAEVRAISLDLEAAHDLATSQAERLANETDALEGTQAQLAAANRAITSQAETIKSLTEALTEIARLRTELSGDFSRASHQSDIARAALSRTPPGEARMDSGLEER